MNHLRRCIAVLAVAVAIAGCASTTEGGPTGSAPPTRTTTPGSGTTGGGPTSGGPTSSAQTGGGSMTPPYIACQQGDVTRSYDGATPNPVELCLLLGAVAHLTITPPPGATWALPTVTPGGILSYHAARSRHTVTVTATASGKGTATLSVPNTAWRLRIAVP